MHAESPKGSVAALSPSGDCVFAATLLAITLLAIVLRWLLRLSDPHRRSLRGSPSWPPRLARSTLQPQAP